jgi:uncharacterized membrane protein (UPF0136 family)
MTRMQVAGLGVAAGIATIVGCVGTWLTLKLGTQSQNFAGTDANRGKTTAIAAGIALVLLAVYAWKGKRWVAILATLAAIASFAFVIWTVSSPKGFFAALSPGVTISRGWGIWLALIGSIVLLGAAVFAVLGQRVAKAAPAPTT